MVYNALAMLSHGGYERKLRFCILLIKLNAIQRQRHHTPGPLCLIAARKQKQILKRINDAIAITCLKI